MIWKKTIFSFIGHFVSTKSLAITSKQIKPNPVNRKTVHLSVNNNTENS